MRHKPCLTLDDALKMVAACRRAGAAKKMADQFFEKFAGAVS